MPRLSRRRPRCGAAAGIALALTIAVAPTPSEGKVWTVDAMSGRPAQAAASLAMAPSDTLQLVTPAGEETDLWLKGAGSKVDLRLRWANGFSTWFDGRWMRAGDAMLPTVYGEAIAQCHAVRTGKHVTWTILYRPGRSDAFDIHLRTGRVERLLVRVADPPAPASAPVATARPATPPLPTSPLVPPPRGALPRQPTAEAQLQHVLTTQFSRAETSGSAADWQEVLQALDSVPAYFPKADPDLLAAVDEYRAYAYLALKKERKAAEAFMRILTLPPPTEIKTRQDADTISIRAAAYYQLQKLRHQLSDEEADVVDGV
ncbi:MAG: hypothetical protein HN919_22585 [Verrucomicrobia bacterium]|nr:hypothetical protein [Verrucomicrobiota bacterium]MBT7069101.1 hypothetical protein [Verrucomicrobiota bacterium]MBT7701408.1 hypothetical protein [Verrucomicrobiota bacterium]